jgi:hypothetical protein
MRTNLVSHEIHELNRRSTGAAFANVKAAEKTSWTTMVNVLLLWITAPVTLVLQYFGSERAIFSFERNPRTFGIAIVIVFSTLPLLTFALYSIQRGRALLELMGVTKMKKIRHRDDSGELCYGHIVLADLQLTSSGTVELQVFHPAPLEAA